jgi:hypothetical protein
MPAAISLGNTSTCPSSVRSAPRLFRTIRERRPHGRRRQQQVERTGDRRVQIQALVHKSIRK